MSNLNNTFAEPTVNFSPSTSQNIYPEIVPLSEKERKDLKWSNIRTTILGAVLWCTVFVEAPEWADGFRSRWLHAQESISSMLLFFFVIVACLFLLVMTVGITYCIIKIGYDDSNDGIKHTGLVDFVSKTMSPGTENSINYYVELKWVNSNEGQTIQLENRDLYGKLKKGSRIYLEVLPHSNQVLTYRIL
jgi:hypothetical protein